MSNAFPTVIIYNKSNIRQFDLNGDTYYLTNSNRTKVQLKNGKKISIDKVLYMDQYKIWCDLFDKEMEVL